MADVVEAEEKEKQDIFLKLLSILDSEEFRILVLSESESLAGKVLALQKVLDRIIMTRIPRQLDAADTITKDLLTGQRVLLQQAKAALSQKSLGNEKAMSTIRLALQLSAAILKGKRRAAA